MLRGDGLMHVLDDAVVMSVAWGPAPAGMHAIRLIARCIFERPRTDTHYSIPCAAHVARCTRPVQEHTTYKPIAPTHSLKAYKVRLVPSVGSTCSTSLCVSPFQIATDVANPSPIVHRLQELYQKSLEKPDEFWREQAHKYLHVSIGLGCTIPSLSFMHALRSGSRVASSADLALLAITPRARTIPQWFKDFDRVSQGSFEQGDVAWFLNGKLNASVCCIDQHLPQREDQVAIIWEGDEPGDCKYITYKVRPPHPFAHCRVRHDGGLCIAHLRAYAERSRNAQTQNNTGAVPRRVPAGQRHEGAGRQEGRRRHDLHADGAQATQAPLGPLGMKQGRVTWEPPMTNDASHHTTPHHAAQIPEIVTTMLACTRIGAPHR